MNKHTIGLLCGVLVGGTALAQQSDTPSPSERAGRPTLTFDQVLRREDADGDGRVSKAEFKGPAALFARLDRNGDEVLTREEFAAAPAPDPSRRPGPVAADVEVKRDIVFGKGGGRDLKLHLVFARERAKQPAPAFVWIHGGGWQNGSKDGGVGTVTPFVRQGFVGATIEYRLTGEAAFPAQIEDCKCAIRYLRAHAKEYGIDPDRIAVGGSSAGGHLAALVGTSGGVEGLEGEGGWGEFSSRVQAVVDLYGPTDFQRFVTTKGYESHNQDGSPESKLLGGGKVLNKPDGIRSVNPITYVDRDDPPFLIIHGSNDRTVPANQSEALHEALMKAGVPSTLHIIEGAGHGGAEFGRPEIQAMREKFLGQLLSAQPKQPATGKIVPPAPAANPEDGR